MVAETLVVVTNSFLPIPPSVCFFFFFCGELDMDNERQLLKIKRGAVLDTKRITAFLPLYFVP